MLKKIKEGLLIAIEGIDGAGKSTHVKKLKEMLEASGFSAVALKEPTDSKFGRIIRDIAADKGSSIKRDPKKENYCFIEDRKIDVEKNILPNLKQGSIVVMDRYFYSNIAYQGALGLDPKEIKRENEKIAPIPDIVFILDIAPKAGINRIVYKRGDKTDVFEEKDYLEKVRNLFLEMKSYPNVRIIDAGSSRKIEEITDEIFKITGELICQKSPFAN